MLLQPNISPFSRDDGVDMSDAVKAIRDSILMEANVGGTRLLHHVVSPLIEHIHMPMDMYIISYHDLKSVCSVCSFLSCSSCLLGESGLLFQV